MTDCVFCRIVARQSPADIEYEDDAVVAFKDIYPKAPVHVLIVPRRHIPSLAGAADTDAEVLGRCVVAARRLGGRRGLHRGVSRQRTPVPVALCTGRSIG